MPPLDALVDDLPWMRPYFRYILEHAGYRVQEFQSGMHFLEGYQPEPGCILSELCLDGLPPGELPRLVHRRGWSVPVILTSGFIFEDAGPQQEDVTFLRKPFLPLDLLAAVHRILCDEQRRMMRGGVGVQRPGSGAPLDRSRCPSRPMPWRRSAFRSCPSSWDGA